MSHSARWDTQPRDLGFSGDIEDCLVAPVSQGQFTPLPEALCWAILELTSQRQAATLDTLRSALKNAFPAMQRPSRELVYDALAKLMQERKIYHTSQGYFVVTPETKRLRRDSGTSRRCSRDMNGGSRSQGMLMSNDEAVALVHGEMLTLRDGDVTHQAVQTNLADVICGGKAKRIVSTYMDKIHTYIIRFNCARMLKVRYLARERYFLRNFTRGKMCVTRIGGVLIRRKCDSRATPNRGAISETFRTAILYSNAVEKSLRILRKLGFRSPEFLRAFLILGSSISVFRAICRAFLS